MSVAEAHTPIETFVEALPEIYQPIFGHDEFSSRASRNSIDRLTHILAVHDVLAHALNRPVRVLDLGCAQGFFSLHLAARGAVVRGIDFAAANVALCRALSGEHPDLQATFEFGRIEEIIPHIPVGSVDLVLGLSVFHHLVFQSGVSATQELIAAIAERASVGVFEMALPSEPLYWAAAQPEDPRVLLSGYRHVLTLAKHGTHLSHVSRPLYVASVAANDALAAIAQRVEDATASTARDERAIACVQCDEDGTPRFQVRSFGGSMDWEALAAREAAGGVEPDTRLFLEMQLEHGDLVVDLAPQAGFVALAAATALAKPHVLALVDSAEQRDVLRLAASEVDAHIETLLPSETTGDAVIDRVRERVILPHRVIVHADAAAVLTWAPRFSGLAASLDVLAWCIGGSVSAAERAAARALLIDLDFVPQQLASSEDGIMLVDAEADAQDYIALHASVLREPATEIFPADTTGFTDGSDEPRGVATPATVRENNASPEPARSGDNLRATGGLMSQSPGFHFVAPYCRTGYGISGAYLLRSLLSLGAPVSFFPLGALDRTLIQSKDLDTALDRQDTFDPTLPSVRLSQQFDLALHVGRGPRMGFPIFELNRFSSRARHHLAAQDQLLVCSEWARGVLLENGLWRAPIHVVPLGVDRAVFHETLDRGPTREETVFLQVGKWESRKGQRELLTAFEAAFSPSDKVRLVLACHNPFLTTDAFTAATAPVRTSRMSSRITLLSKPFASHADIALLMASADCGVFASRAEGWNLEALEMLSCGREVIATDYSAHTAFLNAQNAHLIEIDSLEDAPGFSDGNGAWAAWGAAQHEQLVEHLRAVHARRRQGPLPEHTAGIATAERFSWDAAAIHLLAAVQSAMR